MADFDDDISFEDEGDDDLECLDETGWVESAENAHASKNKKSSSDSDSDDDNSASDDSDGTNAWQRRLQKRTRVASLDDNFSSDDDGDFSDDDDDSDDDEPMQQRTTRPNNQRVTVGARETKKRNVHSIAHEWIQNKKVVFFSIDLEHGGERAGILQLSSIAFDQDGEKLDVFSSYIKPPKPEEITDESTQVHGLGPGSPEIRDAQPIDVVWPNFVEHVEDLLDDGDKRGVVIAWGGKGCDLEWMFRVTDEWCDGKLEMPQWLEFFLDPGAMIKHYTGCSLNNKKTGQQGYGLELLWCHVKSQNSLPGAHNLLVDAQAQMDVLLH